MSLYQLPAELITEIVQYVPHARDVAHLGQSSKRLHAFVEEGVWGAFTQQRFPSFLKVKHGRDAARLLTGLSKNWDRRAVVAQYSDPVTVTRMQDNFAQPWKKPTGQTMGFQPAIDGTEDVLGDQLDARLETLVYSAGSQILLRQRDLRSRDETPWLSYRPYDAREGADDVTALRLLKPLSDDSATQILYGTAAGKLGLLYTTVTNSGKGPCTDGGDYSLRRRGPKVTSIDVAPSRELFAVAADKSLALYSSQTVAEATKPSAPSLSTTETVDERDKPTRIWKTSFVGSEHLAVGVGPCEQALQVYRVTSTGLSREPIRKFSLDWTAKQTTNQPRTRAVYAIAPLPTDSIASRASDQVFLAGYYDGIVRLHDIRTPEEFVANYHDPVDDAAIYSLAAVARERLVAGGSRHNLLKFFDLRMTGGRNYSYDSLEKREGGFNLFMQPPKDATARSTRRAKDSSVYALSIPSSTSPNIYAGIEDDVVHVQFVDSPRMALTAPLTAPPVVAMRPRRQRDRRGNQIQEPPPTAGRQHVELAMYDHSERGDVHLKVQSLEGDRSFDPRLDEIWISTKEKANRVRQRALPHHVAPQHNR